MAEKKIKTIAILTSGGDAPGMNAVIRAVVRAGIKNGLQVIGIERGYAGLLNEEFIEFSTESVKNIIERGGTMLFTARCEEMRHLSGQKKAAEICKRHGIDALVVAGGDGSFRGAKELAEQGVKVIGVPCTIDLDIGCTEYTIGFDTAVNTAMEAVDKIRDTSASHERCSIIEVMGRSAGYLGLWCGIASGAEEILLPELYDGDEQSIIDRITESRQKGKKQFIIINAEGVGHSASMARRIEAATGIDTRATILGYMQRGGSPTCRDRVVASVMGDMAVQLVLTGEYNRVIALKNGQYTHFDIGESVEMTKELDEALVRIPSALKR